MRKVCVTLIVHIDAYELSPDTSNPDVDVSSHVLALISERHEVRMIERDSNKFTLTFVADVE